MESLLRSTARELRNGRAPLNEAWLARNDVTFDECVEAADTLAFAIDVYLATMKVALEESRPGDNLHDIVRSMTLKQGGAPMIIALAAHSSESGDQGDNTG